MSHISETTPILHHNENEEAVGNAHDVSIVQNANKYFERPLRILNIFTISTTFLTSVLATAIYIALQVGPFDNKWSQGGTSGGLAVITISTSFALILTLLIDFPNLISALVNLVAPFFIFPFTLEFFNYNYPVADSMCSRSHWDGHKVIELPLKPECVDAVAILRYFWIACAVLGLIAGVLVIAILVIRIVALAKSRFWTRASIPGLPRVWGNWRNATGFTVHFSFSVIPAGTIPRLVDDIESGSGRDGRREHPREEHEPLIET